MSSVRTSVCVEQLGPHNTGLFEIKYMCIFRKCVGNVLSSSLLSKNLKIKIYRTIILPVVLYGRETRSLTLREECRLRLFENRVLRRIFGPKRDEVRREWRKLHNEELNPLNAELNPISPLLALFGAHHILHISR